MSTGSVEVVYRGIFQKTLAKNICRWIIFAARKEGKIGTTFGRYGDSPERNGIPAKQFAVVADTAEELEEHLAKHEPNNNDVTIAADDTPETLAARILVQEHRIYPLAVRLIVEGRARTAGGVVAIETYELPDDVLINPPLA